MSVLGDAHTAGTLHAKSLSVSRHYGVDLSSTDYDSVIVAGPVSVSGELSISLPTGNPVLPPPAAGQDFIIIDNQGAQPVNGTFTNLAEDAVMQLGSLFYRITYKGGDGNDVELISATQPAAVADQDSSSTVTGQVLALSVSMTSPYGTPAGSVSFYDNGVVVGTATLANGAASIHVPFAAVGSHSITASYAGAGAFVGVDTAPLIHIVARGGTSTDLSLVPSSNAVYGDSPIRIATLPSPPPRGSSMDPSR